MKKNTFALLFFLGILVFAQEEKSQDSINKILMETGGLHCLGSSVSNLYPIYIVNSVKVTREEANDVLQNPQNVKNIRMKKNRRRDTTTILIRTKK
jgi:hypothetical protein